MNKILYTLILILITLVSNAQKALLTLNDTTMVSRDEMPNAAPPIMEEGWNQIPTKFFTMNFGLALILDHTILVQDDHSVTQVGKVDPATEFRGDRFILSGKILGRKANPLRYNISANFNGLDAPEGKTSFEFIDWNIEIPFGKEGGWLTIGKQKEGVGHEYVAPGTQLTWTERGTGVPAFVRQRNVGIRYSNCVLHQRMAYTMGVFNNYWETGNSFEENGTQFTTRITGLPLYTSDRNLVHLGIGYRYTSDTKGNLSYKAKPEANSAPFFLTSGNIEASGANGLMLEALGVRGPLTFMAEYMNTVVNSGVADNPSFTYWQIGGSWFITGENRKYNKNNGALGKLFPKKNFDFSKDSGPGAFELGLRYTQTDMTDGIITGGNFGRFTTALSWYPNAHFRLETTFGKGSLDKNDLTGKTDFWQFRLQFEI
jgi:phosphate-selective porin OprO and OprP